MIPSLLKDLQDAFFPFPDPSAEPKPRKNNVFFPFRRRKSCARPSAQNTVKKQCFCDLTRARTRHRKLTVGLVRGWVGGRGGQRISGQGPAGPTWYVRQFSPLRRRPCRRPLPPAKNSRVLQCFLLFPFFPIFRSLWLEMGQHGPT